MYECIDILTEFRTGVGAFCLVIQCFCKKKKKGKPYNNSDKRIIIIIIRIILRTV